MNINRHNYEEIFLLYVDNELTGTEKNAVEIFVQQNPDLYEELLLLQQSILNPGAIEFEEKASLFKGSVLKVVLQEKLLLKLDNELDNKENETIESLITSDKAVKQEWDLLQQVKLTEEPSVVFIDKPSLYRKDGGRLLIFPWKRIAVAAILLGFGTWGTFLLIQKNRPVNNGDPYTSKATIKNKGNNPIVITPRKQIITEPRVTAIPGITRQQPATEEMLNEKAQLKGQENGNVANNNLRTTAFKNINNDASNKKVSQDVPQEIQNDIIAGNTKNNTGMEDETVVKLNTVAKEDIAKQDNATTTDLAARTTFKESNEEINDNHIFYIKEDRLKKTKVGALFSKVKKTISQTTLVNTIKSVGVGNLEFAIQ